MKSFQENLLKYGACLLVFTLPIFYIGNMYSEYTSPKIFFFYGLVEILMAFWLYILVVNPSYRLNKKTLLYFLPLFIFIFWMTLAGIFAANPHLSFWSTLGRGTGLLTLFHCLVFALIVASLIKHDGIGYLYRLMIWMVSGGFVLALSVWCGNEGFNSFSFLKDSIGGGLMGNSSLAAAYLLFILGFGFFFLFSKNLNKNKKYWVALEMAVILFSPLFINLYGLFTGRGLLGSARGATLGIIVGLLVAGVWQLVLSQKRNIRTAGIVLAFVGLVLFSTSWIELNNPNTELHQAFIRAATGTRFIFADISGKSMAEHPWFGDGPENYMVAFQKYFSPQMALSQYGHEGWNDRAHNIFYDTGVSGGYPAIIFYALFIVSMLYALYCLRFSKMFSHLQIGILSGLIIGYVFQNLFVFDSTSSLVALFSLAGIIFAFQDDLIQEKYLAKPINLIVKNILAIMLFSACFVSLIFFVWRPAQKAIAYHRVVNMPVEIRGEHYSDLLKGSLIGEDWETSEMAYNIYEDYNANPIKIKNDEKLLPYAESDIKGLIQYLETVTGRNKTDARLYLDIAYLNSLLNYFSNSPYDPALAEHLFELLNQAKNLSPTDPQIYWSIAQVYGWKGDIKGVEDTYLEAIALDPSVPSSHEHLISFAKAMGDQKLYDASLLEAEKDIPGFSMGN
jgi:O-antigen ligase